MGWDFRALPCTKEEIIEECTKSICSMECIAHSVQANELWSVWEKKDGTRVIILFLLASQKRRWGYKEIAEESGPHYYKCPMKYLEMAAVSNQSWRDKMKAIHESKVKNRTLMKGLKVGNIVTLDIPGNDFQVVQLNPFMGVGKDSRLYRLAKNRVVEVKEGQLMSKASMPLDVIFG